MDIEEARFQTFEAKSLRGRDGWKSDLFYLKIPIQHDSWQDLRDEILNKTGARTISADLELGLRVLINWVNQIECAEQSRGDHA